MEVITHKWTTEEEYEAQIGLPVHLVLISSLKFVEADIFYETQCGLRVGAEKPLRTTDDERAVTCEACLPGTLIRDNVIEDNGRWGIKNE